MDSIEVAVRFTEAIMAKSNAARTNKGADLAEQYVDMFAEVLERLNVVLNVVLTPQLAEPLPSRPPRATSEVFPLTHDR